LPAIAEADELHRVETVLGRQCFARKAGEALHPEREPLEILAQLCRTLGEYNFAGQYQQAPTPLGGGMVKAAWFKNYAANELPDKFEQVRAELGYRQQGLRAQRFQRLHELGH
jgi:hypothetical protein